MKKVNMIFREKKPLFWMALAFVMMIGVLSLCVWPLFSRLSADQALWQDLDAPSIAGTGGDERRHGFASRACVFAGGTGRIAVRIFVWHHRAAWPYA